jgi:hypothetical protein
LDPEAVGKELPAQFVKEEGRSFALCLYSKQHPTATQKDLLCYATFLAAAEDPPKLEAYRQTCLSEDRVSHIGKLENIVFNMADSPSADQVTLKVDEAVRAFWVPRTIRASGFGMLVKKICSLSESSCLLCTEDGDKYSVGLKPDRKLVSAGPGFPGDAQFCSP